MLDEAERLASSTREACRVIALRTRVPLVFSHRTALNLMGIRVPGQDSASDFVHVCVPHKNRKRHLVHVVFHAWSNVHSQVIDSLVTCTMPIDAWCQVAADMSINELVVLGDRLTCAHEDMRVTTLEDLCDHIDTCPSFHGIRKCRTALGLIREGTDSSKESEGRLVLVDFGLPNPVVNHPIRTPGLSRPHKVDMAYPEQQVCIEFDGLHHYHNSQQWQYDQDKRETLRAIGWDVIVITNLTLSDQAHRLAFARRVSESLARRGLRGHQSLPSTITSHFAG